MTRARPPPFPDPAAAPEDGAALIARWEAVLARAPGLRPWLEQMIARRRALLNEAARGSIEEALWVELKHWVGQFEALPQFAVSAISTTLQDPALRPPPAVEAAPHEESPERAFGDQQALMADPAFALAFHCVEERIRPVLPVQPPAWAWFALLHASARPQPLLTPEVAVTLVLRLLGAPQWAKLPISARNSALRLFHATAGDLRAASRMQQLCGALPWAIAAEDFVAAAGRARAALIDASALCARLAAAARPAQSGGLSVLTLDRSAKATPEEVSRVTESARNFNQVPGLRRLLALL